MATPRQFLIEKSVEAIIAEDGTAHINVPGISEIIASMADGWSDVLWIEEFQASKYYNGTTDRAKELLVVKVLHMVHASITDERMSAIVRGPIVLSEAGEQKLLAAFAHVLPETPEPIIETNTEDGPDMEEPVKMLDTVERIIATAVPSERRATSMARALSPTQRELLIDLARCDGSVLRQRDAHKGVIGALERKGLVELADEQYGREIVATLRFGRGWAAETEDYVITDLGRATAKQIAESEYEPPEDELVIGPQEAVAEEPTEIPGSDLPELDSAQVAALIRAANHSAYYISTFDECQKTLIDLGFSQHTRTVHGIQHYHLTPAGQIVAGLLIKVQSLGE